MIGETIVGVYDTDDTHDWFCIQTSQGMYELRLGGIKKATSCSLNQIESFDVKGLSVKTIWSDDFWVYVILSDDSVLIHGQGAINADGDIYFTLNHTSSESFAEDYGADCFEDDDFFQIIP
ncbi:MAG: hypothetical protein AB8F95_20145 [Bacteroidia bacterium]